jgi:hypothetical protein
MVGVLNNNQFSLRKTGWTLLIVCAFLTCLLPSSTVNKSESSDLQYASPKLNAQSDEFPIDLYIAYDIWVDNIIPPGPAFGYNITYHFTRWIDQDDLVIEYELNFDGSEETLVDRLPEILFNFSLYPPLWVNVSSWEVDDLINLSGIVYEIEETTYHDWNDRYYECFYLYYTTWLVGSPNATAIFYHSDLGILTGFFSSTEIDDEEFLFEVWLLDTNFGDYFPLLDYLPGSVETTTTSTNTTTIPIVIGSQDVLLVAAIMVEIVIIALIFRTKK